MRILGRMIRSMAKHLRHYLCMHRLPACMKQMLVIVALVVLLAACTPQKLAHPIAVSAGEREPGEVVFAARGAITNVTPETIKHCINEAPAGCLQYSKTTVVTIKLDASEYVFAQCGYRVDAVPLTFQIALTPEIKDFPRQVKPGDIVDIVSSTRFFNDADPTFSLKCATNGCLLDLKKTYWLEVIQPAEGSLQERCKDIKFWNPQGIVS